MLPNFKQYLHLRIDKYALNVTDKHGAKRRQRYENY